MESVQRPRQKRNPRFGSRERTLRLKEMNPEKQWPG